MTFKTFSLTSTGGRKANQDTCDYVLLEDVACWVVADGLGGHRGGEVASRLAVEQVLTSFRNNPVLSPAAIEAHLDAAQMAVVQRQAEDPLLASMRTTLVLLLCDQHSALWAHVGDSRLYHFRKGRIIFQTKDHSVPQVLVAAGDIAPEEIRFHTDRNRLLRVMGQEDHWQPEVRKEPVPIEPHDAFLLCTDGFWEHITEPEMEKACIEAGTPKAWMQKMENKIRERAIGEFDNYTAIAVCCEEKRNRFRFWLTRRNREK